MGYVFDLDGTLVDSVPTLLRVINRVLGENGLRLSDREENLSVAGWGLAVMFRRTLENRLDDDSLIESLTYRMLKLYKEDPVTGTVGYPGAYEFLRKLQDRGERFALITNKLRAPVDRIISNCFPDIEFTKIYSPDGGWAPKPANESLRDFRDNVLKGERLVFVGDTELDYHTAYGTADEIRLALWGYRGREKLLSEGFSEEMFIDDFSQII